MNCTERQLLNIEWAREIPCSRGDSPLQTAAYVVEAWSRLLRRMPRQVPPQWQTCPPGGALLAAARRTHAESFSRKCFLATSLRPLRRPSFASERLLPWVHPNAARRGSLFVRAKCVIGGVGDVANHDRRPAAGCDVSVGRQVGRPVGRRAGE